MKVAIGITTYRNPARLRKLLRNIEWAGRPDLFVYVVEDRSPHDDSEEMTKSYREVIREFPWINYFTTTLEWGCMQGSIEYLMKISQAEWMIYVPDDVAFTKGGLWNEYAGILTYGREWMGGIQAPYWNATDLTSEREEIWDAEFLKRVPQNQHWNANGLPRKYVNLNGAGFSLNRELWKEMGGFPSVTWRLDEYAGYMAWKLGFAVVTLPGQPRVHYFGGATPLMPQNAPGFHTVEAWKEATGGTPEETGAETYAIMDRIQGDEFNDIMEYFNAR